MPRRKPDPVPPDLGQLAESWQIHLSAERKSPETVRSYLEGVRGFLAWCATTGAAPQLTRPSVNAYVAGLLADGAAPATARVRHLALRRFSAWLLDEGEIDRDALLGLKPPKLDTKVVEILTDEQLRAMIKTCRARELRDCRDEAVLRFMVESGARAGEVVAMGTADVDLPTGVATVRRGKGGKGRRVPFGPLTGQAIDRYLRKRRSHRLADTPALWLGDRGKQFTYQALYKALKTRAELAGITGFHPHVLRHTAATRWLAAKGSEGGLMAVAGWSRRDMIDRYTKATSEQRAVDEARGLHLGEL